MKLINDTNDPTLLGIMQTESDLVEVDRMVSKMNEDLIDSGFDQYQYQTIRRGNKVYVEMIGA